MAKRKKPIKRKGQMRRFSRRIVNTGPSKEGMEALAYNTHARGIAFDERVHSLMAHALRRLHPEDFNYNGKTVTDPKLAIDAKLKGMKQMSETDFILACNIKRLIFDMMGKKCYRYMQGSNFVYVLEDLKQGLRFISSIYRGEVQAILILKHDKISWQRKEKIDGNPKV